ncbi:hypothetical protein SCLCIDRAFT_26677 [Scleroderma citrinum Foug A]|uniref:tripeptidyl-peptidase II n=1 Tax=Scleroderma citrinum Foug A TaxID=1036808 RepID=A0A0C3A6E5_9AGAM|nr:hypothetical protein SCLCIDRAFT_26677 [Scleroderma citrinum Foug A]
MKLVSLLGLYFAASLVSVTPSYKRCKHKVKESLEAVPHGWVKHAPAPPDHVLELKIALPQPHFPILEQHIWDISDPNHVRYGAQLSKEETLTLMAPHHDTLHAVDEWLASYVISEEHLSRSSAQDWVTIRVPVSLAEEMLDTKYYIYGYTEMGESIVRTSSYSLPEILHKHIEFIQPTTMFARFKALEITTHLSVEARTLSVPTDSGTITGPAGNPIDNSCNTTVVPSCIRQLYNAVDYNTSATNGNNIAVSGFFTNYANVKDLQDYYAAVNPAAYGSNFTFLGINGAVDIPNVMSIEGNIDSQIAFGLTYPTPAYYYLTNGTPPFHPDAAVPENTNEPYALWLDYMLSADILPQTISVSYGEPEETVPEPYARRVCAGLGALGARGVSIVFASGDFGVGNSGSDPATQKCLSNDGHNKTRFMPSFPASCPYVTAVGGARHIPEVASSFSGGGFSNYFDRPLYQYNAVDKYLELLGNNTYEDLFSRGGRVIALNLWISLKLTCRSLTGIGGTSTSTPAFAAIVSMLNDARINAGKSSLGFLNPWLYSTGFKAMNDITEGNNPGCGTQGFHAAEGWDAVTGFGTPDFKKLKELALALS